MPASSTFHSLSSARLPCGVSGGSGTLKKGVPRTEVRMRYSSKILRASRIFSIGCSVLYLPQIDRTSAYSSPKLRKNRTAVTRSSSISSVVTPSFMLDSGTANRQRQIGAAVKAASKWRRLQGCMSESYRNTQLGESSAGGHRFVVVGTRPLTSVDRRTMIGFSTTCCEKRRYETQPKTVPEGA